MRKLAIVCVASALLAGQGSAQQQTVLGNAQTLAAEIALFQPEATAFVATWNATGLACAEARRVPFGNLRQPCRAIRAALRDGEFLLFARRCFDLGERHKALVDAQRAVAMQPEPERNAVETALLENEERLIALCSPSTWQEQHPAFAELRAEASDPRYRTPANRFFANDPDYRLQGALESTLGVATANAAREAPVTGAGSFASGSRTDSP